MYAKILIIIVFRVMNGDLLVYYAVFGALYLSFIDIVYFDIFFYNYSYYFAFVGRTEPIKIGDYQLTVQQQFGVLGCSMPFFFFFFILYSIFIHFIFISFYFFFFF